MANREFKVLSNMLKKYVSDEDYKTIMSGDAIAISQMSPTAQAKYKAYRSLCESLSLCDNEEFNRLVEEKATAYRNNFMANFDREKFLNEEVETVCTTIPEGITEGTNQNE